MVGGSGKCQDMVEMFKTYQVCTVSAGGSLRHGKSVNHDLRMKKFAFLDEKSGGKDGGGQ